MKNYFLKNFIQKKIVTPVIILLKQGSTPEKLAMSLCMGAVLGCFPILGTATLLCIIFAQVFKLNHVAVQISNYAVYPLHILLVVPFLYAGNAAFGYDKVMFNVNDMVMNFETDPQIFFQTYLGVIIRACLVWAIFAVIVGLLLYFPLKISMRKLSKKIAT